MAFTNIPGIAGNYKDSVDNLAALPTIGNEIGDVRTLKDTGVIYYWDGSAWQSASGGGGGTVTDVTATAPLSSTGGATPDISITLADSVTDGYLSAANFNTFNNKQPAGNYITALTGDVTAAGPGSSAATVVSVGGALAADIASTVDNALLQGGNAFGVSISAGSTDNFPVDIIANGQPILEANPSGSLTLMQTTGANLLWDTDGAGNIGDVTSTNRPMHYYGSGNIFLGNPAGGSGTDSLLIHRNQAAPVDLTILNDSNAVSDAWSRVVVGQNSGSLSGGFTYLNSGLIIGAPFAPSQLVIISQSGVTGGMLLDARAGGIRFAISDIETWRINTGGHFICSSDGSFDIGQLGATRPRRVFIRDSITMGTSGANFQQDGFLAAGSQSTIVAFAGSDSGNNAGLIGFFDNTLTNFAFKYAPGSRKISFASGGSSTPLISFHNPAGTTAHLIWEVDGSGDIGAAGANRPRNLHLGSGLFIAEGANASMGISTLVAGTVTVSTTKVTANSRIQLTIQSPGGVPGTVYVNTRSAGVSFDIVSTSTLDTSVVAWLIVEPS